MAGYEDGQNEEDYEDENELLVLDPSHVSLAFFSGRVCEEIVSTLSL